MQESFGREMLKSLRKRGIEAIPGRPAAPVPDWNRLKITFKWPGQEERTMTMADFFRRLKKFDEDAGKVKLMVGEKCMA